VENITQFFGNIHPLFSSERILKIGLDLRKLLPKVWWLPFLEHGVYFSFLVTFAVYTKLITPSVFQSKLNSLVLYRCISCIHVFSKFGILALKIAHVTRMQPRRNGLDE